MDISQERSTRYLQRPGGRLAFDLHEPPAGTGAAPLVVAGPGLGDLRSTYRLMTPSLVAAGYRVATLDLRGHGESSTGWNGYTPGDVADDLVALVEHLGGPATLLGNSYSGSAAVIASARRPDLVSGLVLLGAFVRELPQTAMQRFSVWLIARTPLGRPMWNAYVPSLYAGAKPADQASALSALRTNLRQPGRWAAVAAMAGGSHAEAGGLLGRVTAPALVVMGEKDPDFPDQAAEARAQADLLGGPAEVVMVPDAGHYPQVQRPDVVAPAVLDFLSRTAGRP